ncbi:unnamed protein product [Leptosia nina]|uniref:Uncharacterized protein n=1 Tax=Leptosia nina TaxID=320188 RepID=A0AAV1JZT3_9NEOP
MTIIINSPELVERFESIKRASGAGLKFAAHQVPPPTARPAPTATARRISRENVVHERPHVIFRSIQGRTRAVYQKYTTRPCDGPSIGWETADAGWNLRAGCQIKN